MSWYSWLFLYCAWKVQLSGSVLLCLYSNGAIWGVEVQEQTCCNADGYEFATPSWQARKRACVPLQLLGVQANTLKTLYLRCLAACRYRLFQTLMRVLGLPHQMLLLNTRSAVSVCLFACMLVLAVKCSLAFWCLALLVHQRGAESVDGCCMGMCV